MDTYWFSKKTYDQLQAKYEALQISKADQYHILNEAIQMDHSPDDLNDDYMTYKEIQRLIQQVEDVITRAKIIEDSPVYQKRLPNEVHVGTIVTLQYNGEEIYRYTIVGYGEGDIDKNHLSYTTELAQEILGRKLNETFLFLQGGFEHTIQIIDIEPHLN